MNTDKHRFLNRKEHKERKERGPRPSGEKKCAYPSLCSLRSLWLLKNHLCLSVFICGFSFLEGGKL